MRWRWMGIAIALLGLGSLAWRYVPEAQALVDAITWIQNAGPLGHVVFAVGVFVYTVLMLPASWSHTTAGFLYGPIGGLLVASLFSTVFSSVNFLLGRTLFRDWVTRRTANNWRFRALDDQIAEQGAWMVLLLRLPPVSPFNPMSYALGATKVRYRDFLLGTWAGSLLPVTLFTQLGASLSDLAAFFAGEAAGPGWLQWVGLAITVVVTLIVTRYAKAALDKAARPDGAPSV